MDELPEDKKSEAGGDIEDGLEPASKIIEAVEITDRDVAIFKLAHEHRYLAYGQIREAFWKGRSEPAKACYRRIERLVNSGYLRKGDSKKKSLDIYFITEKALVILRERGFDSGISLYEPTKDFDRSIDHDLKVISVRILFRGLGLDSWTSERLLRARDHLHSIPDGVLNIRGKRIAIEFENHLTKSMERYQELFHHYGEQENYLVLLVIVDGDTKDWLVRALDYNAKRIWMTTYHELINDREEALFENKRASFKLSRLL
ncbi:MAG: hypothetical protein A3E74_03135 [Omnitrophica bacterium RIFCSPHIGHO2_12_FULL_44_12]|nr:MAG: hypothetical protein A3E74_03135 [Omnitrophica bacterium RIFCSPHIGHO2_12_FULL_44_12]